MKTQNENYAGEMQDSYSGERISATPRSPLQWDVFVCIEVVVYSRLIRPCHLNNMLVDEVDVKNAFLNDVFKEENYTNQSGGFIDAKPLNFICKSKKTLYGLK